jgi:hypothetical protein
VESCASRLQTSGITLTSNCAGFCGSLSEDSYRAFTFRRACGPRRRRFRPGCPIGSSAFFVTDRRRIGHQLSGLYASRDYLAGDATRVPPQNWPDMIASQFDDRKRAQEGEPFGGSLMETFRKLLAWADRLQSMI